jgi:glycosyltransferase involved in cell wall biosynthesis
MTLLVAILAYNEEDTIAATIADVIEHVRDSKIIVIDDGSNDSTRTIVKSLSVEVISLPFNCGIGIALKTALLFGIENDFDSTLIMDGDGQHLASEISKLLNETREKNIVIGVRNYSDYKFSVIRKLGHLMLVRFLAIRASILIADPTSGFRIFSRYAATKVVNEIDSEYLEDTVGILRRLNGLQISVTQVNVQMKPRQGGIPSSRGFQLVKRYILALIMIIIGRKP